MTWQTAVREHGDPLWKCNPAIRFATREEAEAYGADLRARCVEECRAEESEGPASYSFSEGKLRMLTAFPHPYS